MNRLSDADRALLHRIEANIVGAASRGREVIDVGPFRAFIARDNRERYFNYAVPTRNCEDWSAPLEALCAAFEARDRMPRFEYVDALWPGLLPVLEAAGFTREIAAPLMALNAGELIEPASSGAELHLLRADDDVSMFREFEQAGAAGFGAPLTDPSPGFPARHREGIAAGELFEMLARLEGGPAGCGTLMRTGEVAELAGVATVPAFRRRGIAAELCAALIKAGFDAGIDLVWLSAGSDSAVALYRMLGFRLVSQQLHYSRPA